MEKNVDCFVLMFDVSRRSTFDNVMNNWIPELTHYCMNTIPIVLVGTKIDLREEEEEIRKREMMYDKPY